MRIIQNKILIIDDDNEVRKQYVDLFRKNDFEVLEAKDGVEGLNIVKAEEGIDVIFTGIIMPRMDGFKLISILKEDKMTANIPVVVNSHLGKEEDKEKSSGVAKEYELTPIFVAEEKKESTFSYSIEGVLLYVRSSKYLSKFLSKDQLKIISHTDSVLGETVQVSVEYHRFAKGTSHLKE